MVGRISSGDYPVTESIAEIISNPVGKINLKNFSELVCVENGRLAFMVEVTPRDVMDSESIGNFFSNIRKVAEVVSRAKGGENELEIYIDFSKIPSLNISSTLLRELGNTQRYAHATGITVIKRLVVNLPEHVTNTYSQGANFNIQLTIGRLDSLKIGHTQVKGNIFAAFRAVSNKMWEEEQPKPDYSHIQAEA